MSPYFLEARAGQSGTRRASQLGCAEIRLRAYTIKYRDDLVQLSGCVTIRYERDELRRAPLGRRSVLVLRR